MMETNTWLQLSTPEHTLYMEKNMWDSSLLTTGWLIDYRDTISADSINLPPDIDYPCKVIS